MWLHKEHGQDLIRIPQLKEEQKILATFNRIRQRNYMLDGGGG
jgi:hypothetical protein